MLARAAHEPSPRLPWRTLLTLFVGSRLIIWLVAGLSLRGIAKGPHFTAVSGPLDWFLRWDAPWYLELAKNGYYFTGDGDPTNVVFLPLYPALVWLGSLAGLLSVPAIGYVVSLASLWLACVWLWRLVEREWHDAPLATTAVAILLFSPVSFFFSIPYSEGLFLALAIGCIACAREDRWWWAGILGALAAGTRFVGLTLVAPLAWQYFSAHRRADGGLPAPRLAPIIACALPLVGYGVYCLLMWIQFDDPMIFFRGQLHWGGRSAWWWDFFARDSFAGLPGFYRIWFAGTILLSFGLLILGVGLRVPTTYLVYALGLAGVYISSRFAAGVPRYFSVVFPLYVILALAIRRWPSTRVPLFGASAALQALSVTLFVNGYWFT